MFFYTTCKKKKIKNQASTFDMLHTEHKAESVVTQSWACGVCRNCSYYTHGKYCTAVLHEESGACICKVCFTCKLLLHVMYSALTVYTVLVVHAVLVAYSGSVHGVCRTCIWYGCGACCTCDVFCGCGVCAVLVVYNALNCGVCCTSGVSVFVACQFCTCEYCTLIWCLLVVHMLSWCRICVVYTGGVHSVLVVYTCSILVVYVVLVVHTCMYLWCMLSWWHIRVACTCCVCCPGGIYV